MLFLLFNVKLGIHDALSLSMTFFPLSLIIQTGNFKEEVYYILLHLFLQRNEQAGLLTYLKYK